jgi:hypothetical protein
MIYPLRSPRAKTCQNNSITEYQGIYQPIKACTSLSKIGNWEKEPWGMTTAVTKPIPMNPLESTAQPDDWKSNRYRNGVMKSVKKILLPHRPSLQRPCRHIAITAEDAFSLIILLINCEHSSVPHYFRKLALTRPLLTNPSL